MKNSLPTKAKRAVELATKKRSSSWLTVIPLKELDYNLNKKEFRDAIKLRYDWEITDAPMLCACGVQFNVDHAMVCQRAGFIIQRHNELHDLKAEMLRMVCNDVEVEPVFQEVTGETMPVWIFMLEVFGRDRDLHSSTSGCVTLMQTLTKT